MGVRKCRQRRTNERLTEKATQEGFVVVYPEGTSRFEDKLLPWNAGHCCGYAIQHRVNDGAFISTLIDKLIKDYPVDPKRIYVTGISNGGMMTHRLGIELSNRFAAIAPVVATLFGDENKPQHPVSASMLNGTLDKSVPNQGGPPAGRLPGAWDATPAKPALEQGEFWAGANACASVPDKRDHATFIVWQYPCPAGRAVEIYLIKDQGHAWPGGQKGSRMGDEPSSSVGGTDVIWEFFKAHAK
jgi:polyhydroxybutyrate depolymerase